MMKRSRSSELVLQRTDLIQLWVTRFGIQVPTRRCEVLLGSSYPAHDTPPPPPQHWRKSVSLLFVFPHWRSSCESLTGNPPKSEQHSLMRSCRTGPSGETRVRSGWEMGVVTGLMTPSAGGFGCGGTSTWMFSDMNKRCSAGVDDQLLIRTLTYDLTYFL